MSLILLSAHSPRERLLHGDRHSSLAEALIPPRSISVGSTSMSVRGSVEGGGMFNPLSTLEKRGDQFRLLYEQLKEEYATLNDAYTDCQRTLEKSTEDNRQMQEKFKNLLDKLQLDNRKKQSQIEEMKTQVSRLSSLFSRCKVMRCSLVTGQHEDRSDSRSIGDGDRRSLQIGHSATQSSIGIGQRRRKSTAHGINRTNERTHVRSETEGSTDRRDAIEE